MEASHPHRVLDCLSATIREEDLVETSWSDLGDQVRRFATRVVGETRLYGAHPPGLFDDCFDESGILVADIDVH
jgi:hypothetical protein